MMHKSIHPSLYRSLYVFIIVAVATVSAASFSYMYMDSASQQQASAQRALKIWKNRVNSSRQNNNIIDEYETTYLYLINHGVIGNEDRLSWYETIQSVSESRGMPSVKYSVSSQEKYNSREVAKQYKKLQLYRSIMTMDIKMSHEGDLFALINNLRDRANGLFVIDRCDLERIDIKQNMKTDAAVDNMKAYCELSWYTIRADQMKKG
jgi:hypothetical protein